MRSKHPSRLHWRALKAAPSRITRRIEIVFKLERFENSSQVYIGEHVFESICIAENFNTEEESEQGETTAEFRKDADV